MTTLSLLKSMVELDKVVIRNLPIPTNEVFHQDTEWMKAEVDKWSKQYPTHNQRANFFLDIWVGLTFKACISKERLLSIRKALDITLYIETYILSDRFEESGDNSHEMVNKLLDTLKTGEYEDNFHTGKRLVESLADLKGMLTKEVWELVIIELDNGLRAHLDIHCNYWLKKRLISVEDYVPLRLSESFWPLVMILSEHSVGYEVPTAIRNNQLVKALYGKVAEFGLAVDDYITAKMKIMRNEIANRVVCLLAEKRCSLQEAIDIQYDYTMDLYKQCNDLMDKINASLELRSDKMSALMAAMLNQVLSVFKIVSLLHGVEVDHDQTLKSAIWEKSYNDLVTKSPINANMWDF